MEQRVIKRYSSCFKQQVVAELESGRWGSVEQARGHYEIGGKQTIQRWLRRWGKNHLLGKVVRVEQPGEADRIVELKNQLARLQQALGQTQAQSLLHAEYLALACQELGVEVEVFKKNVDGKRSPLPLKSPV